MNYEKKLIASGPLKKKNDTGKIIECQMIHLGSLSAFQEFPSVRGCYPSTANEGGKRGETTRVRVGSLAPAAGIIYIVTLFRIPFTSNIKIIYGLFCFCTISEISQMDSSYIEDILLDIKLEAIKSVRSMNRENIVVLCNYYQIDLIPITIHFIKEYFIHER